MEKARSTGPPPSSGVSLVRVSNQYHFDGREWPTALSAGYLDKVTRHDISVTNCMKIEFFTAGGGVVTLRFDARNGEYYAKAQGDASAGPPATIPSIETVVARGIAARETEDALSRFVHDSRYSAFELEVDAGCLCLWKDRSDLTFLGVALISSN